MADEIDLAQERTEADTERAIGRARCAPLATALVASNLGELRVRKAA